MYMRFVHLTLHSRSRLRSRTHILANVIETNKRSLPNSRLFFFIVLVLSARLAILTAVTKHDPDISDRLGLFFNTSCKNRVFYPAFFGLTMPQD